MADQHQVNSILACDARKEDPDHRMDPEEAKQQALTDAGLQIVPIRSE
jgi:hypothetical protein